MATSIADLMPLLLSDPGTLDSVADGVDDGLLDAARSAFLDFGIRRTSMGEIARRAGISPATLYRRYRTKDDLVAAIALREARRFLVGLDQSIDIDAPADEQLADGVVVLAQRFRNQPLLNRIKATEPESVLPRLTSEGAPMIELGTAYLVDRVRRIQARGGLDAFDPEPLAEIVTRLVHSLSLTPCDTLPFADDERLRSAVLHLVRGLLHPAEEGTDR